MFTSRILINLIKRYLPAVPGKRKTQKEKAPERKRKKFRSSHYRQILFNSQLALWSNKIHTVRTDRFYSGILAFFQRVADAIKMSVVGMRTVYRKDTQFLSNGF